MVIGENISDNVFDLLWDTVEESPIRHWPAEVAERAGRFSTAGLRLRYCYNTLWSNFILAKDVKGIRYMLFQEARVSNPMDRLANHGGPWRPDQSWLECAICTCAFNARWGTMWCAKCSSDITKESRSYAMTVTMATHKEEWITHQCAPRTGDSPKPADIGGFLKPTPGRWWRYTKYMFVALGMYLVVSVLYKQLLE